MPRIWDISQRLHAGLPVWPGEPAFALEQLAAISESCPVNVSRLSCSVHTGSHADSPFHYDPEGATSADCDLAPYLGRSRVIDARAATGRVTPADFDPALLQGAQRVIFRTFETFPHTQWVQHFTAIDPAVIEALVQHGVVLVGTDAPSLDPQDSKTMDAHQVVRTGDLRILEGLVLDGIAPGDYELIALPLKISGADASPVRARLRETA